MSADELIKLAELYRSGMLTKAEFDDQKRAVLEGRQHHTQAAPQRYSKKPSIFGRIIFAVLGIILLQHYLSPSQDKPSSNTRSSNQQQLATTYAETMPVEEKSLLAAVVNGRQIYQAGQNDMAKGASRPRRAEEICSRISDPHVHDWVGVISILDTNQDGKGVRGVDIGQDTVVKTWNNSLSDFADKTLIEPNTSLFASAIRLKVGDVVSFSGDLMRSATDCFKEGSLTLAGSITSPEFIFKFDTIKTLFDVSQ